MIKKYFLCLLNRRENAPKGCKVPLPSAKADCALLANCVTFADRCVVTALLQLEQWAADFADCDAARLVIDWPIDEEDGTWSISTVLEEANGDLEAEDVAIEILLERLATALPKSDLIRALSHAWTMQSACEVSFHVAIKEHGVSLTKRRGKWTDMPDVRTSSFRTSHLCHN
jgi:hypothetical protein